MDSKADPEGRQHQQQMKGCDSAEIRAKEQDQDAPDGQERDKYQDLVGQVVYQRPGQDGMHREQEFARQAAVLDLVGHELERDLRRQRIDDQQDQVIGGEIVGRQPMTPFWLAAIVRHTDRKTMGEIRP